MYSEFYVLQYHYYFPIYFHYLILCSPNILSVKYTYNKLTRMTKVQILLVLACLLSLVVGKPIYDFKKSYVTQLTNFNFKDQVTKIRQNTNYVAVVQFYKYNDGKSLAFAKEFDEWVLEFNGVFRIGAVDCDEYAKLCQDQGVTVFPTFKIYPPNPIPITTITEDYSIQKLQKIAAKYLHANVIEITNANLNTFTAENPSVPKVLLFTDKKGVPMIYKGLSVAFQKKLNFGIVRETDSVLVSKYQIKSFPSIIVLKTGERKPFFYTGKEFNFKEIFTFLNIYSEVFVPGGGSSLDSSATKQWMTEIFPELHHKSAKDICLATEGTLCVILITSEKPSKALKDEFEALNAKYDRKIERGTKYKFMWLNGAVEKEWASIFGYSGNDQVVILNPGKRKRYTPHDGPINKDAISTTLETIIGGNARFNRVSDNLPSFEIRAE